MKPVVISLFVSYGQLAVFPASIQNPFNDWSQSDVDNGFAWSERSVSFRTLREEGVHQVTICVSKEATPINVQTIRSIEVPFTVPSNGRVEIASISESGEVDLYPGCYQLRCDFLGSYEGVELIELNFAKCDSPKFQVGRADSAISPNAQLLQHNTSYTQEPGKSFGRLTIS